MPEKQELPSFDGWDTPRFTPIPDQLFDEWLPHLSEAELKVLLYIMRRTYGFKKSEDAISLRQMAEGIVARDGHRVDYGAGVALRSIQRAIPTLLDKGLIEAIKTFTDDGDPATTVYRLRMKRRGQSGGVQDQKPVVEASSSAVTDGLSAELVALDKEISGGNTWALAQPEAQRLCTQYGWSAQNLCDRLRKISGRTIALRLQTLAQLLG